MLMSIRYCGAFSFSFSFFLNFSESILSQGIYCEHSCPVGTEEDYLAVRADHNIDKFPNSRYREDTDGVMTGEVCSGHGTCDDKGDCLCDEYV